MSNAELTVIEPIPTAQEQAHAIAKRTFDEIARMSVAFGRSGFFGIKNAEQAMSLMMIAEAEGLHPARAFQEYHVIQNRPSLRSDAMLARYQRAGGKIEYLQRSETCVEIKFTHEASGSIEVKWDIPRAKGIKVWKNQKQVSLTESDTWKNYPTAMLTARCISEGVRASYPACIVGFYAPEEVEDFGDKEPNEIKPEPKKKTPEEPEKDDPGHTGGLNDTRIERYKNGRIKKPKRLPKTKARKLYAELSDELGKTQSETEMRAWFAGNAYNLWTLPSDWETELNEEMKQLKRDWDEEAAASEEDLPPHDPENGEVIEPGADFDADFDEVDEKSRKDFTPTEEEPFDDEIPF